MWARASSLGRGNSILRSSRPGGIEAIMICYIIVLYRNLVPNRKGFDDLHYQKCVHVLLMVTSHDFHRYI